MLDPETAFGLAAIASLVFVILGSWVLHSRLRNAPSRFFFWSVVALAVWMPTSTITRYVVLYNFETSHIQSTLNWLFFASEILVPGLLLLLAAISFWLAVPTIRRAA